MPRIPLRRASAYAHGTPTSAARPWSSHAAARALAVLVGLLALLGSTACGLAGSGSGSAAAGQDKVIKLVASDSPATVETIATLKDELQKQGYELQHVIINDIVQPNQLVEDKQADVNMFQHEAYMKQWNADHGSHIVPAFYTNFLPAALFSKKWTSLAQLPEGAKIGVPADPANSGRALLMLQDNGLLKVKPGIEVTKLSVRDVTDNPKKFQFIEVDQLMLLRTLDDVDAGFMFGGTAVQNGLSISRDALATEKEEGNPYRSIIGTRPELLGTPKIQALQKAYQNDRMKETLLKNYKSDPSAVKFLW